VVTVLGIDSDALKTYTYKKEKDLLINVYSSSIDNYQDLDSDLSKVKGRQSVMLLYNGFFFSD
jgi:hypothetical protein